MSIVPKEAIEVIAQTIGINNLSPDVSLALAPDVEYRMREIIQEAIKCMRHSRRTVLTVDDVDAAVLLRNLEPIYGFASGDSLRFKRVAGHKDLFYIDDKDMEFKDVIEAPLPKAPLNTSVTAHWLAIEGIQPAIPENALVEATAVPSDGKRYEYKEDGLPVDIKMPVKHVLSKEIQLYFNTITELTMNRSNSALFNKALVSLATDAGLHPLMPYFACFIADEVTRSLNNFLPLFALMRVVRSLIQNPHIHIEPYLHQLMPCIITCLVAKRLGNRFSDNHWDLRNFTANIIATICKRYGHAYHNLQPRVTRTLLHAFLDPTKALPQHYGAIQGLAALGPSVVRLLVLPNLEPYLQLLEPEMILDNQKNNIKKLEAWRVYGALVHAVGLCMNDRRRIFTSILSPPKRSIWKINKRVITKMPNKRKASTDNPMHQPPLKRMAMEGPMGIMPVSSTAGDMQGAAGSGFSNAVCSSTVGMVTMHNQLQNENMSGREVGVQHLRKSSVLAQAPKLGMNSGRLMASLLEHFGESLSSFIPKPESSFFL